MKEKYTKPLNALMLKDNFLDDEDFDKLSKAIESPYMPYYIQNGCAKEGDDKPLMTHFIVDFNQEIISSAYELVAKPLIKKLNCFRILRLKINCYPKSHKPIFSDWHIDLGCYHKVCLFNVNDNNGYTDFKNKKLVVGKSLKNSALFFDGKEEHRSVSQTDALWRYNINIDYE